MEEDQHSHNLNISPKDITLLDPVITLNVSGRIFMTYKSVLSKSGLLGRMLEDVKYKGETIFLGRHPVIFEHVLDCLLDEEYPYPSKYRSELDYFLIDRKSVNLYNDLVTMRELEKIREDITELKNVIQWEKSSTGKCEELYCSNPTYDEQYCSNHSSICSAMRCFKRIPGGSWYCSNH